jgi:hypothetical protein
MARIAVSITFQVVDLVHALTPVGPPIRADVLEVDDMLASKSRYE